MSADNCRPDFRVPRPSTTIILNELTLEQKQEFLKNFPFSIALSTGTYNPSSSTINVNDKFMPDRSNPLNDPREGGKTFVWTNSLFTVYNKFRLVLFTDVKGGFLDEGNPLPYPFYIRVVKLNAEDESAFPVGGPNPNHDSWIADNQPSNILLYTSITTQGIHIIDMPILPSEDCMLYVHTEYVNIHPITGLFYSPGSYTVPSNSTINGTYYPGGSNLTLSSVPIGDLRVEMHGLRYDLFT
jgi:hypothetical protein